MSVIGLQYDENGNPIVNGKAEKKYTEGELVEKINQAKAKLQEENTKLKEEVKRLKELTEKGADPDGTKDPGGSDKDSKGSNKK